MKIKSLILVSLSVLISLLVPAQINVNYNITPQSGQSSISPLIYGFNWEQNANFTTGQNFSFVRMGGNRATAYNWENNASNAGTDWHNSSDDFWCYYLGISSSETPGIAATTIIDQAKNNSAQSLITLQMAGYVSADKSGDVTTAAPNSRWCEVIPAKGSAFSLTPNLTDGKVYIDEFVNFLKSKYGTGGVKYALDNEPDLWSGTHPLIHPNAVTCQELIDKTTTMSKAVKAVDGSAEIFGFVSYGFNGYLSLQNASDWESVKGSYSWFIDYYLDKMKVASNTAGKRLVDVLDLHWYPEATGDQRIINSGANSTNDKLARLQAPRALWDTDYTENSWISQYFSSYLPLLPKIKSSVNTYYPNTKLAFTEFQYGGYDDITGAISLSDVLGIFGKYDVYAATHWGVPGSYGSLAYKLYRNYDGNNSTYGDVNIGATMSDKVNSSVYASVNSVSNDELHIIALNKSMTSAINGTFTISSSNVNYSSASVYAVNDGTASIVKKSDITVSGNTFTYTLPALSAYHFVLKTGGTIIPVTGVSVAPASLSLSTGGTGSLTATVSPINATNQSISWSTSNSNIATVSSTGVVTAISSGSTSITATTADGGYTASCAITVSSSNVPVTGVTMSPTSVSLAAGATSQLTATIAPTNATNKTVSWTTSNSSIATVSSTGLVAGIAAGSATITVTTQDGSKTATCAVTVTSSCTPTTIIPYIQVNDGSWSQSSSVTVTSGAKVKFGPQPVSGGSWSWSGLASGTTREVIIYPTESGIATATYTNSSGCQSTQNFVVTVSGGGTVAVTGVTMSPTSVSVAVGATSQLTATIAPTNATNKTVSWSTSNSSVATVSTSGLVTGVAAGSTTITVTTADGGKTATATITVTSNTVEVTGVTVSPTSATLSVNATQQLTATVSPTNATNKSVSWSTSNSSVATVSSSGLVTGVAAGSATITVTTVSGGKTASCAITVNTSTGGCSTPTNISIPFSYDGAGDYCWFTTTAMAYVNSWNLSLLTINGTDYTNQWSNSLPAAQNGGWTIHYIGLYAWSHFEAPQAKNAEEVEIAEGKISIYPNPFRESFNISIPNPENVNMVVILDQMGREISIFDQSSIRETMEIGKTLTAGMYIVRVYSLNGTQTFSILKAE